MKDKFNIICAKDFEYELQRYLFLSIEITKHNTKRYILVLFKLSTSKVVYSFSVPYKVRISKLKIIEKNQIVANF